MDGVTTYESYHELCFSDIDVQLFYKRDYYTIVKYICLLYGQSVLKFMVLISDMYSCVKLLAFNTWSNNIIQPCIPFKITKWLFSACILLSIVFISIEIVLGMRILMNTRRRDVISQMYLNNFSRITTSLVAYKKFCIYDHIEPSNMWEKLGVWAYFELKGAPKLIAADSPRQLINGLTLWSILISKSGKIKNDSLNLGGIFHRIKLIAVQNHEEAVFLSFMTFSCIVWSWFIFKFCMLMVAAIVITHKLGNTSFTESKQTLRRYAHFAIRRNINDMIIKKLENSLSDCESEWSDGTFLISERNEAQSKLLSSIYTPCEAYMPR